MLASVSDDLVAERLGVALNGLGVDVEARQFVEQ